MHYNTILSSEQERFILTKLRMLPLDKIAEVSDFVDFINPKKPGTATVQSRQ